MNYSGSSLEDLFRRHRESGESLVLATIVSTVGSTYRKAGAQMLIAPDGAIAGLLSGGCLESDLAAHARPVFADGRAKLVEYDTRTSDDLIWGIGLGCEGAMQILLSRLDVDNGYEPFAHLVRMRESHTHSSFVLVVESKNVSYAPGAAFTHSLSQLPDQVLRLVGEQSRAGKRELPRPVATAVMVTADEAKFLVVPIELPVRLLVLGAGPDAMPLAELAGMVGWDITVADHRPAYAVAERFPRARHVLCQPASALTDLLSQQHFDAAVIMSHHLLSDAVYLAALAASTVPYIGLLGPAPRRMRLLNDIGERAYGLKPRLYGPIGLDIGANTPETIALAIVSEIQSVLTGHIGGSFSAGARADI
jgi:xanthine dehydrogenase accessory factor